MHEVFRWHSPEEHVTWAFGYSGGLCWFARFGESSGLPPGWSVSSSRRAGRWGVEEHLRSNAGHVEIGGVLWSRRRTPASSANPVDERVLAIPLGILVAISAPLSARAIYVAVGRRRRRSEPGVCVDCGYDLRATQERCPECGRAAGG